VQHIVIKRVETAHRFYPIQASFWLIFTI